MRNLRKLILGLGLLLFVVGGISLWRAMHPPLTTEQQIVANMDDAARALENRLPRGILRHLAPEFSADGTSRKEFDSILKGMLFQWREVQVQRFNERVEVNGDSAVSSGTYRLSYRSAPDAPIESQSGSYSLQWRLLDGEWKVVAAKSDTAKSG